MLIVCIGGGGGVSEVVGVSIDDAAGCRLSVTAARPLAAAAVCCCLKLSPYQRNRARANFSTTPSTTNNAPIAAKKLSKHQHLIYACHSTT